MFPHVGTIQVLKQNNNKKRIDEKEAFFEIDLESNIFNPKMLEVGLNHLSLFSILCLVKRGG